MAVFADAQYGPVEAAVGQVRGKVGGVTRAFGGGVVFTAHAVDVFRRHGNVVEQGARRFAVVAFRVGGRDAAFVAPPEVQVMPGDFVAPRGGGERLVECFWRAAAGEGDVYRASCTAVGGQRGGDGGDERGAVVMDVDVHGGLCFYFGCRQTRPLRAIILSASVGPQLPGS